MGQFTSARAPAFISKAPCPQASYFKQPLVFNFSHDHNQHTKLHHQHPFFNIKGAQTQQLPATWPEVNSSMNAAAAAALYHQTPPCPKLDLLHLPPFAFHWTTVATAEMRAAESPATNKHEHWLQKKKNFKATRLQITGTSPHLPLARNQWTNWPVL